MFSRSPVSLIRFELVFLCALDTEFTQAFKLCPFSSLLSITVGVYTCKPRGHFSNFSNTLSLSPAGFLLKTQFQGPAPQDINERMTFCLPSYLYLMLLLLFCIIFLECERLVPLENYERHIAERGARALICIQ